MESNIIVKPTPTIKCRHCNKTNHRIVVKVPTRKGCVYLCARCVRKVSKLLDEGF